MTLSLEHQEGLWLLWMGVSALLTSLWFAVSWKRRNAQANSLLTGGLVLLLGVICGAVGAKLFFILFRLHMFSFARLGEWLWPLRVENVSYYGGIAGVCFGVFLTAKLTRQNPGKMLNTFAPMLAFLAAMARFAEAFLGYTGVGVYLDEELAFPLAVRFTWDGEWFEYYLAVFVFEGIFSLVACIISLCHKNETDRLRRTLFYLCLPQVLFESMRAQSIVWLFVRVEQLLCFVFCELILAYYALKTGPRSFRNWVPALVGLLVCGLLITGEFALDGKIDFGDQEIPNQLIYGIYVVLLALIAVMEHIGHRRMISRKAQEKPEQ